MRYSVYYDGEPVKIYELDEPVISIGRLPENTIPISNMGVSRRHVKIEQDTDKSYVLSDLNSLNGTFVNGKKIKKVTLCHGDKICIGKYTIIYETDQGPGSESNDQAQKAPEPIARMREQKNQSGPTVVQPAVDEKKSEGFESESASSTAVLIETTKHIVYKLDRAFLTLGSDEEDDIFVNGFMINKAQAVLEQREDGFYIIGQKLMAKIKVNGKSVRTRRLEHKDRIEIGSSTFRFMENG